MRPCHPIALRVNQVAAAVAIGGILIVVAVVVAAMFAAFGLASIPATAAFGMAAIPYAAALLAIGGVAYAVTSSHAY